ncbi:MAG: N-acetyltransferase [Thermomicrobiales bacterium]|nr:MAG: N-acetyltransferase [Thermomicrobiales bacterium]
MSGVTSVPPDVVCFVPDHLPLVSPWYLDPDVQRWLGGPGWPEMVLQAESAFQPGDEFRGRRVLANRNILLLDGAGQPVALAGGELYDRETQYAGTGPDGPRFVDAPGPHKPEAGLVVVVDPQSRRQGWGALAVQRFMSLPDFALAESFIAGIEPENLASRALFERLGFVLEAETPDWEDMLNYRKYVIPIG